MEYLLVLLGVLAALVLLAIPFALLGFISDAIKRARKRPENRDLPPGPVVGLSHIKRFVEHLAPGTRRFFWGGAELPELCLDSHFVLTGMTGSGKTLCMRMLAKSVFCPEPGKLEQRGLFFDPKSELVPQLLGMGVPKDRIIILNPFHEESLPLHLSADFQTKASAEQLSAILAPPEKATSQPYFGNAARDLLAQTIIVFQQTKPLRWTLADVLRAMSTPSALRRHLSQTKKGRDLLEIYFDHGSGSTPGRSSAGDVVSTIRTKLAPYETVAALWEHSEEEPISLREWVNASEPSILVLGSDDTHSAVLEPINRALFLRFSQLLTARAPQRVTHTTWVFVDELRLAGRLEGLSALLLKGRPHVRCVLAYQDFEGLKAVYGDYEAGELVGQCGNVAVFRLNNVATMEHGSRFFGDHHVTKTSFSVQSDPLHGRSSVTHTYADHIERIFLAADLRNIPPPSIETGIPGVFTTSPLGRIWADTIPPEDVARWLVDPSDTPGFKPRPEWQETLADDPPSPRTERPLRTMDDDAEAEENPQRPTRLAHGPNGRVNPRCGTLETMKEKSGKSIIGPDSPEAPGLIERMSEETRARLGVPPSVASGDVTEAQVASASLECALVQMAEHSFPRARLRLEHPDASPEQIEELLHHALSSRPHCDDTPEFRRLTREEFERRFPRVA